MRFQANHTARADHGIMEDARRELQPVPGVQSQMLAALRQAEGKGSADHVNHLVEGVPVRGIHIARPV